MAQLSIGMVIKDARDSVLMNDRRVWTRRALHVDEHDALAALTGYGLNYRPPTSAHAHARRVALTAVDFSGARPTHVAMLRTARPSGRARSSSCAAAFVSAAQRSVADGRVQEQEQLQRRALVADAAGRGRRANFL